MAGSSWSLRGGTRQAERCCRKSGKTSCRMGRSRQTMRWFRHFVSRATGRSSRGGVLPREYDQMLNFPPSSVCTLFIWAEPTHHASSPGWASAGLRI